MTSIPDDWDLGPIAGDLIKLGALPFLVDFRPAGSVSGIPLVEHTCKRPGPAMGCLYVSAEPSAEGDTYVVPFCGCRPIMVDVTLPEGPPASTPWSG